MKIDFHEKANLDMRIFLLYNLNTYSYLYGTRAYIFKVIYLLFSYRKNDLVHLISYLEYKNVFY